MKRIIAVFITVFMAVCLLTVSVSAAPEAVLSEDLQTLTWDGRSYVRGDISGIVYYDFDDAVWTVSLPDTLTDEVKSTRISVACNKAIVKLTLNYRDGSSLSLGFVENRYAAHLDTLTHDSTVEVTASYYFQEEDIITAPLSDFKGTPIRVTPQNLDYFEQYYVSIPYDGLYTQVYRGVVLVGDDYAYFVDFQENGITGEEMDETWSWPEVQGYEIADPELYQARREDYKDRNDFGITEDDHLGQLLSAIFLCVVFAMIPIGILTLSTIFALKGKGYYKVTWGITAGFSAATLVVFLILVTVVVLA